MRSKPLSSCLVSDFTMVAPPITPAKVRPVFEEYLAVLDAAGLREFFEPVSKRVTLSSHVGVNKPDRAVFMEALSRLQSPATLEECLFITENADHIRAARQTMGMTTLQFKSPEATCFDFDDWSQAPALIAHLVDPHQPDNLRGAVQAHLAAHGVETVSAEPTGTPGKVHVTGQIWHKISVPGHPELDDVHVAVPVEGELTRGQKGELAGSLPKQPDKEQLAEAGAYVSSLATQGRSGMQGAGRPAAPPTQSKPTLKAGENSCANDSARCEAD